MSLFSSAGVRPSTAREPGSTGYQILARDLPGSLRTERKRRQATQPGRCTAELYPSGPRLQSPAGGGGGHHPDPRTPGWPRRRLTRGPRGGPRRRLTEEHAVPSAAAPGPGPARARRGGARPCSRSASEGRTRARTEARPSGRRTRRRGPGPGNARCHKGDTWVPACPAAPPPHSGRAASATRRLHPGRPAGPRPWPADEHCRPRVTAPCRTHGGATPPPSPGRTGGRAIGPASQPRAPLAAAPPSLSPGPAPACRAARG